jgi:glycosyltransferase involved in cell wall biosynthesis
MLSLHLRISQSGRMAVSIVVPTYHRAYDLSELFESILKQTVKPLEVIVVDDSPNDTIEALCRKYEVAFSKLAYIRNPKERSLTVSRNIGINRATGDFVTFLDSDTVLYSDYINNVMEVFMEHPNALGVQGHIVNLSTDNRFSQTVNRLFFLNHFVKDKCGFLEYPVILTKTINCEWLSGANMTYKREVFDEFQFDENLGKYSYMEDMLFSYQLFKKYRKSLFITPYAKCIHKGSEVYTENKELKKLKNQHKRYVLAKLFGFVGIFLHNWQNLGIAIKLHGKALKGKKNVLKYKCENCNVTVEKLFPNIITRKWECEGCHVDSSREVV